MIFLGKGISSPAASRWKPLTRVHSWTCRQRARPCTCRASRYCALRAGNAWNGGIRWTCSAGYNNSVRFQPRSKVRVESSLRRKGRRANNALQPTGWIPAFLATSTVYKGAPTYEYHTHSSLRLSASRWVAPRQCQLHLACLPLLLTVAVLCYTSGNNDCSTVWRRQWIILSFTTSRVL